MSGDRAKAAPSRVPLMGVKRALGGRAALEGSQVSRLLMENGDSLAGAVLLSCPVSGMAENSSQKLKKKDDLCFFFPDDPPKSKTRRGAGESG